MPPPLELINVCDCIDEVIETYLEAYGHGRVRLGRYEAEVEAYTLQKLVIRHSRAVVLLGRHAMVTLPSALVAARAGFEAQAKIPLDASTN